MGDLIHTLPALTDASMHCPGIRFDWVCERAFAEIPTWHPAVDTAIPINLREWKGRPLSIRSLHETIRACLRLRSSRYPYIIDAQGLIKSALVTGISRGAGVGMNWSSCKEGMASFAYKKRFGIDKGRHAIDRVRDLFARALGYRYDDARLDYGLNPPDFSGIGRDNPYLVFLHGTSAEKKMWNHSDWIELAGNARQAGFEVLVPWANPNELSRAQNLASVCANIRVLSRMTLTGMAGVLAGASGVVGVDTGLSHLAAALGTPAVTLYIATLPGLTGTRGNNQLSLFTKELAATSARDRVGMNGVENRTLDNLDASSVWSVLQEQMGWSDQKSNL